MAAQRIQAWWRKVRTAMRMICGRRIKVDNPDRVATRIADDMINDFLNSV